MSQTKKNEWPGFKEDDKWKIHLYLTMNCKKKYPSKSYRGAKVSNLKVTSIGKRKYDTYQI